MQKKNYLSQITHTEWLNNPLLKEQVQCNSRTFLPTSRIHNSCSSPLLCPSQNPDDHISTMKSGTSDALSAKLPDFWKPFRITETNWIFGFWIFGFLDPVAISNTEKLLVPNDQIFESFIYFQKNCFWISRSGANISKTKRNTGDSLMAKIPELWELFRLTKIYVSSSLSERRTKSRGP